ncbi:MAG: hypothetical protein UV54_C0029G0004 [Candidatus Beckwithbacteria bacterium GW2011_GWA2_43_10]|uniref:Nucleotidyl transferase AbiEii/AbiGii toxin family protein n=1 Tax=Candidatus Beckwithbacteria bacterium GW2011_GWA2_43_10 TaxID=1618369 RepID=A0A0G1C259_9BACT|nr:MAG: hypothetical protein UV54_C0029G0004 [Candidatus Beckwithbacteria bacterium GW2011_GWA2_43_10]
MDGLALEKLSDSLDISRVEIIREETEMLILQELSQMPLSREIIFKGGTALRLCFQSPRFSKDLDFSQKRSFEFNEFRDFLDKLLRRYPAMTIKDCYKKRLTVFGLLTLKSDLLSQPISIKIEISTLNYQFKKTDYGLRVCRSETSPFNPLLYVYSLERIHWEKIKALKTRSQPRDYFDAWLVSQKLGLKVKFPKINMNESQFKGEISQLLPNYLKNWPKEFLRGEL